MTVSALRRDASVEELVEAARTGHPRAVARLISLVEDASPALREIMAALAPYSGHAQIIGSRGQAKRRRRDANQDCDRVFILRPGAFYVGVLCLGRV